MVNRELETPDVWDDAKHAQELGREKKSLEGVVERIDEIEAGGQESQRIRLAFEVTDSEGMTRDWSPREHASSPSRC